MRLKFQEKRLLWLFFIALITNTISTLLISSSLSVIMIIVLLITVVLQILLLVFSIKEITKGNKALGIIILVLSMIDILAIILGFISGLIAGYSAV
jgi:hypothetical protein